MPPQQCPECGRFLKKAFVEGLTSTPTPCPRCEAGLTVETFGLEEVVPPAPAPGTSPPAATSAPTDAPTAPAAGGVEPSVRPPDLRPGAVRDESGDVLAGWDPDGAPGVVDRSPFPTDLAVLAISGSVGAILGGLFGERGCRGGLLGAASGVLGAAIARQIWRLP